MHQRLAIGLVLATTVLMSACGGPADSSSDGRADDLTPAVSDVGSLGDAVEVAAAAPGEAAVGACDVDRRTLETAVEMYYAMTGDVPTGQDDLIAEQLLKEASPRFDIAADGTVVVAAGSPCS